MGSRLADRLLEHGHHVVVWNRDRAKAEPLGERGAGVAETAAAAAGDAEATITMVTDPHALAAVTEGTDGVAAGLAEGATLIQMSTVSPDATARLAGLMPEGALSIRPCSA